MRSIRLKFGFALPSTSSCYLGIARKRSLLSVRYSVPPRRSAICKLCLHCARWQRRFSGSLCSQREQFCPAQSSTRAPLKEAIRLFRRKPNIAESRRRAKKELSKGSSKPIRARLLEKEIIQTRITRLNKIFASARTKNWAAGSLRVHKHPLNPRARQQEIGSKSLSLYD